MKQYIFILLSICLTLVGCSTNSTDTSSEITSVIAEDTPTPTSTTTPTPKASATKPITDPTTTVKPTPTPEPLKELSTMHFDVLDIDLPYLKSFDTDNVYSYIDQIHGYTGFDDDKNNIHCEISAYLLGDDINMLTDEPNEYNEYFFEGDTSVVKEWEDVNKVFTIHAQAANLDTVICINRNNNCHIYYKLMIPSDEYSSYVPTIDYIFDVIKNIQPNPQVIDEETIVKECQKRYGSPLAEIDHYQDINPVVHCYEFVEDGDDSHFATWGWAVVDPVTGAAYDSMTLETFTIPGSKIK